ncbi:hypothetical protein [Lentzea sp.]|uniref:hypothetical protein n=1 Tax=Lentzea sp. TaxID=56099 RepID=UPI002ED51058
MSSRLEEGGHGETHRRSRRRFGPGRQGRRCGGSRGAGHVGGGGQRRSGAGRWFVGTGGRLREGEPEQGQVRDHLARNPCKSLDRTLFAVAGEQGDITPLATPLLDLADIRFTGLHHQSRSDGSTVVIAETESASGQVSGDVLDAMADVASWLPGQAAGPRR